MKGAISFWDQVKLNRKKKKSWNSIICINQRLKNDKCGSDHVPKYFREYSNESMTLNQQKQNRCRAPLNGRSMTWPKCSMKPLGDWRVQLPVDSFGPQLGH